MKCSICGKEINKQYAPNGATAWDKGHNAEPINNGRCCTICNDTVVIPRRIQDLMTIERGDKNAL